MSIIITGFIELPVSNQPFLVNVADISHVKQYEDTTAIMLRSAHDYLVTSLPYPEVLTLIQRAQSR